MSSIATAFAAFFPLRRKLRQSQVYKLSRRVLRTIRRGHYMKLVACLHPGCHQAPNRTALNRYPEIFSASAAAVPNARRILSFGCSTGEECITLARYFPTAQIVGVDINPLNLLKARKHRSEQIRFAYASDRIMSEFGGFDAVFCMSVFMNTSRSKRERLADCYPFDRFEERALFLESVVRPGGLLVIHGSPYRFGDTAHKCVYEAIPVLAPNGTVYLPDGVTRATPEACIFRKLAPYAHASAHEVVDLFTPGSPRFPQRLAA
jgi:SAM-dependent methyltransferase